MGNIKHEQTAPTRYIQPTTDPDYRIYSDYQEAQLNVLGLIAQDNIGVINPEYLPYVRKKITTSEIFDRDSYRVYYEAVCALHDRGLMPDSRVVIKYLRENNLHNICTAYDVVSLAQFGAFGLNSYYWVDVLRGMWDMMQIRRLAGDVSNMELYGNPPAEVAAEFVSRMLEIVKDETQQQTAKSASEEQYRLAQQMYDLTMQGKELPGIIYTHVPELNEKTGGIHPGELCLIAGRPGMGKTEQALLFMSHCAMKQGKPTFYASFEMKPRELINRLAVRIAGVDQLKARTMSLRPDEYDAYQGALMKLSKMPVTFHSDPTLAGVLNAIDVWVKSTQNPGPVFIDYLQLMNNSKASNREREIGEISAALKQLAQRLNIPIILLSQLNRQVEARTDKRPMLSDLRDSGSIEQDADMVIFLYRPEYYGITVDDVGESTEGLTEFIISKSRGGGFVGTVKHDPAKAAPSQPVYNAVVLPPRGTGESFVVPF